jgi:hypothetical protein
MLELVVRRPLASGIQRAIPTRFLHRKPMPVCVQNPGRFMYQKLRPVWLQLPDPTCSQNCRQILDQKWMPILDFLEGKEFFGIANRVHSCPRFSGWGVSRNLLLVIHFLWRVDASSDRPARPLFEMSFLLCL